MAAKKESKPKKAEKTETKSESKSADSGSEPKAKKSSGTSARPISYFSSVSTDDYRDGWDAVFSKKKTPAKRKPKPAKVRKPAKIELAMTDLDDDLRQQLEAAFRAKAKKKRISYDKLSASATPSWTVACEFAD